MHPRARRHVAAAALAALATSTAARAQNDTATRFDLEPGDRIVLIGNTFGERLAQSGCFDALAHAAHPDHRLVIRHLPWSGDEVAMRPRETNVPKNEFYIEKHDASVVVMSFGMSESFNGTDGLAAFEINLAKLIDETRAITGADGEAPRIVLLSPIEHEDLGPTWAPSDLVAQHNQDIADYVAAMGRVAADKGVPLVNLFDADSIRGQDDGRPLTLNGIHPTEYGCAVYAAEIGRQLGWVTDEVAPADETDAIADLRQRACDKHYYFMLRYRPTNTEYVWGRRHKPYGIVNFPPEIEQLERMVAAREEAMWEMDKPSAAAVAAARPTGIPFWESMPHTREFQEDSWEPQPVEAKGTETSLGDLNIKDPDEFVEAFEVPDGYVIDCFASENEVPELQNPLAMTFDERGRLWVLCAPTYPHLMPGERPHCKLIVIEDTDGDRKADTSTIFADELYCPTGFAIDTDAVYVGQAPDLFKITDTDGDGISDRREIVASGFGMCDSHHQVSAFEWDPNGGFVFHEGVFTKSQVETAYGTLRTRDAATWRYDPRTGRTVVLSHCGFSNPWGHVYADYGMSILADASGGDNHSFAHVISAYEYPRKPGRPDKFLNRGRPTAGCELIASSHFPEDVQETFLVNQSIGFHGTRWDRVEREGSTWKAEKMPEDILTCTDTNFRPVGIEIGPDGALYILDWCNPIVGHMQYSVRDPRRDHTHGRVWRIRHETRPLVEAPDIVGASTQELLGMLSLPERNTRQHVRRRLQKMPADELFPAVERWLSGLDPIHPLYARMQLEALWMHQTHGRIDLERLERVLGLNEPRARTGAARVLRHWLQLGDVTPDDALPLLERIVRDDSMPVRLEGVVACGFMPSALGAQIAALAAERPMDDPMARVLDETLVHLADDDTSGSLLLKRVKLRRMKADELLAQEADETVAAVMITRTDIPLERRMEALDRLGGDQPAQARRIYDELTGTRSDDASAALGQLLHELPPDAVSTIEANLRQTAGLGAARGAAALSALLKHRLADAADPEVRPETLVEALSMIETGEAPDGAVAAVQAAVESSAVDPAPAVMQIARHATDPPTIYAWMAKFVDAVGDAANDAWSPAHEKAMAALKAMHEKDHASWPAGFDRYHVEATSDAVLDKGRLLYHDETVGCVRCHGPHGDGLEGFPPLNRSPWLLGNPQRAASIVVHGLYGELQTHDGRSFSSVMEPLGATLADDQIAAVLTFARRSWGNFAAPVAVDQVAVARSTPPPNGIWTVDEVLAAYPLSHDGLLGFEIPVTGLAAIPVVPIALAVNTVPVLLVITIVMIFTRKKASPRPA